MKARDRRGSPRHDVRSSCQLINGAVGCALAHHRSSAAAEECRQSYATRAERGCRGQCETCDPERAVTIFSFPSLTSLRPPPSVEEEFLHRNRRCAATSAAPPKFRQKQQQQRAFRRLQQKHARNAASHVGATDDAHWSSPGGRRNAHSSAAAAFFLRASSTAQEACRQSAAVT